MLRRTGQPAAGCSSTAWPKVAEYSKEKPFSHSALRDRIHAAAARRSRRDAPRPPAPGCSLRRRRRRRSCRPSSSSSLVTSRISIGCPRNSVASSLSKSGRGDARQRELVEVLLR